MSCETASSPQKVVLITGAATGIGKACAELLAASGWRVFGGARGAPEPHPRVDMIVMDVDDDASVRGAVATVLAKAGRLDAVINNAGFSMRGAVEDVTIEEAKALFETNFFGVLRVCRAAAAALRANGGYVVNVSSLAGLIGLPFTGHYCASKFALEGMSESLRFEMRPFGVHVVLVEPGDFRTGIKAKRRIAAASREGVYADAFDRFLRKREEAEAVAPTPEAVAALVERILNDPDPKTRYMVGMFAQRVVPPLKRLLPQRAFEWLLRRAIGAD
jgi:NAD(P)-dependent dehydrogenase (short-subunit alcohol dehydrogenase family)